MKIKRTSIENSVDVLRSEHILESDNWFDVGHGSGVVDASLEHANNVMKERDSVTSRVARHMSKNALKKIIKLTKEEVNISKAGYIREYWKSITGKDLSPGLNVMLENNEEHKSEEMTLSDEFVTNILEWNNYNLVQDNNDFERESERYKDLFKNKLSAAVNDGWVPEWILKRLDSRINYAQIRLDDGFTTSRENISGYTNDGIEDVRHVVLQPDNQSINKLSNEHVMLHELTHVMDGRDGGGGGLTRLFKSNKNTYAGTALNEALVEHFSFSLYKDLPIDDLDTLNIERQESTYFDEREILELLCTEGKEQIDIRLFISAHFSHEEDDLYDEKNPIDELKRAIERSFPGANILSDMSKKIKTRMDLYEYRNKLLDIIDRQNAESHNALKESVAA
ncbi:hypothetical protein EON76_05930 [bacterium]|nr:MAG: hypothetical protein EON76_05930 [bacterium]